MGIFDRFRKAPPVLPAAPGHAPEDMVRVEFRKPRVDSWSNPLTGMGTDRDKTTYGFFLRTYRLQDVELSAMYHGDDMAAKIVELPPREMMRRGYDVVLQGEDGEAEDSSEVEEGLVSYAENLRLNSKVTEAGVWGRLFGGALLIIGAEDGQAPDKPLNEEALRSIRFLNVVDRRFIFVHSYYSDPFSPKFGEPEVYYIVNALGGGTGRQAIAYVHESRVIRFGGAPTDVLERRALAGWDYSVLQRVYDALRAFSSGYQGVSVLMADAHQAHMKIPGLAGMIANDSTMLAQRMQLVDMTRSTARMVLLDEGEEFGRENVSFAGLADLIDRMQQRLSAAADCPVAILMGRSAAGLNATGESDIRAFYSGISSKQTNELKPVLLRLYKLIGKCKDGPRLVDGELDINFRALWETSDLEQATVEKTYADRDVAYVNAGVVTAEEVAISRFGSGKFDPTTNIDVAARKDAQAGASKFDPYESDTAAGATGGEPTSPVAPPAGAAQGAPIPPPGGAAQGVAPSGGK